VKPLVAIIGRQNVGKSTLFNKIVGRRRSLVRNEPGVTRDRIYGNAEYSGRQFIVVDTGGLVSDAKGITAAIQQQTLFAIKEASAVIFLMDGRDGITPLDKEIHRMLKESGARAIYAVNKIDTPSRSELDIAEFFELGVEKIFPIAAEHNRGIDDLLDNLVELQPETADAPDSGQQLPRIAIIGRPNVGKSSFLNKLLGWERVIVSEIPGTTRDSVDAVVEKNGRKYVFLDTAGIRRRTRINTRIEQLSSIKAIRTIDDCNIGILMIDGIEGLVSQDLRIGEFIWDSGKGFILVVNKLDLVLAKSGVKKSEKLKDEFISAVRKRYSFLAYVPIIFTSAVTGYGVDELMRTIEEVSLEHSKRVKTSDLNQTIRHAVRMNPPPSYGRGEVRILYGTQISTSPPAIVIFTNHPEGISQTYNRYLMKKIHESFGFIGTPVSLIIRKKR